MIQEITAQDIISYLIKNIARYRTIKDTTSYKEDFIQLEDDEALPCRIVKAGDDTYTFIEVDYIALKEMLTALFKTQPLSKLKTIK